MTDTYVAKSGSFTPEPHRGFLAGLDRELVDRLKGWMVSAPDGVRQLHRREVVFRGVAMFVAEFHDHAGYPGLGMPGLVIMRAMSPDWFDAVRNGLGVAHFVERFGFEWEVPQSQSLEQWLAWQEEVRVR